MRVYLPCKLGESFIGYKFYTWIGKSRAYEETNGDVLVGFDKGLFHPDIRGGLAHHYAFDTKMGYYDFVPKYYVDIPDEMFQDGSLKEKGFNTSSKGHLFSLQFADGKIIADVVIDPRYEHRKMEYPLELEYKEIEPKSLEDVEMTEFFYFYHNNDEVKRLYVGGAA